MRIEKIIFCQPIIIRSIWFSITYCVFEFLEAFLFFSNGSSKAYFYFRFKLTFLDFSFIWTCGALYQKKYLCFNSYRIPINLFWTIEVPCVCVCMIWQVKLWLCLFARFLRHVWHQKHENLVLFILVSWQYLVFQSIAIWLLANNKIYN